jgi:hypothetical protein
MMLQDLRHLMVADDHIGDPASVVLHLLTPAASPSRGSSFSTATIIGRGQTSRSVWRSDPS